MPKPVLIVDDNPNMSALLAEMLEVFDYQCQTAANGPEALRKIAEQEFSLVITDFRMPSMTGIELLNRIKADHPKLPVALITGYNVEELDEKDLHDKADGFLSKPFMISEIETLLTNLT